MSVMRSAMEMPEVLPPKAGETSCKYTTRTLTLITELINGSQLMQVCVQMHDRLGRSGDKKKAQQLQTCVLLS